MMRTFGLDVHKRFAEVAVIEDGEVRRVGRIENGELGAFAQTLGPQDHVVLESTALTWPIAELLGRHAGKVTVSNPMRTKAIASAKVKTDKVDAKVLAQLGAADLLPEVWVPDEITRVLRRRIAHRQGLVRQRTALRNQVHAILDRNLIRADWATDLFGHKGRRGLAGVELPEHERAALECSLRLHDVLAEEISRAERALAGEAFTREQVRRLMTIPGVGWVTALSIIAVIGDIERFPSGGQLVGYLGLDPRVRQSGERGARIGHISRQGQAHARGLLVEAAHSAIRTPGPLRAFYLRLKDRRGSKIALVATARKLAVLCWHLLAREEEYRFQAPSLTASKHRALQIKAGDQGKPIARSNHPRRDEIERRVLEQAEHNHRALIASRSGAGGSNGTRLKAHPRGVNDARQAQPSQAPALLDERHPRHPGA
jgi:transposase